MVIGDSTLIIFHMRHLSSPKDTPRLEDFEFYQVLKDHKTIVDKLANNATQLGLVYLRKMGCHHHYLTSPNVYIQIKRNNQIPYKFDAW
jgi:hypothetical protein